ncbi:hypothetical protein [Marininema halotolerans]|uniref:Uncharacterized protein n=1 Tax=Marininema halotolerans TaxID=1155944 RepID=A0A1I6NV21_9BACL|nr:hypothetical protein [Marininema halotolerans]SFS31797.1 hypothetical protein SAMN05444972_101161 [Marininema halotolerans]
MHSHAWKLYFDFLGKFSILRYRQVSLALFYYFPHYQYRSLFTQSNPVVIGEMVQRMLTDDAYYQLAIQKGAHYLKQAYPVQESSKKLIQLIDRLTQIQLKPTGCP